MIEEKHLCDKKECVNEATLCIKSPCGEIWVCDEHMNGIIETLEEFYEDEEDEHD